VRPLAAAQQMLDDATSPVPPTTRLFACTVSVLAFAWLTRPRANLESLDPAFIEDRYGRAQLQCKPRLSLLLIIEKR
jgi:hypothetical protein